jgi:hypothetical protein
MKTPEFPLVIKRGSVSVTIYETPDKGYTSYTLAYYQGGRRKRETSADYVALRSRSDEILADLNDGRPTETGALKATERSEFVRAKTIVSKAKIPLDVAARHYAEAVKILGSDLVIDAAREYAKRHPVKMPLKLVADVVAEFIAEKEKQARSVRYLETLRSHCKRFADAICMNISSVTTAEIDLFLDNLKVGARTRDNVANSIHTLFEFAKRKRYLPSDYDETKRITRLDNGEDGPIEIFTPKELETLLETANDSLIRVVVISKHLL